MVPVYTQPPPIGAAGFTDAAAAVARIEQIYARNAAFLRAHFEAFLAGAVPGARVRATYPYVRIVTSSHGHVDSRLAYGFVSHPGTHETTVTRPDVFRRYLLEQIGLLIDNHAIAVEIGESAEPVPIHFAYGRDINLETEALRRGPEPADRPLRDVFDVPDLAGMDDAIINGTIEPRPEAPAPLALFRAARIDYSLHRLLHYTGTSPRHFQNFVIFTNYQFYVDAFVRLGRARVGQGATGDLAFVEPGDVLTRRLGDGTIETTGAAPERLPQMPA